MNRKTIKNKTQLRELIIESIGKNESSDCIEFYFDWTWKKVHRPTLPSNYVERWTLDKLSRGLFVCRAWKYPNGVNAAITANFKAIEITIFLANN